MAYDNEEFDPVNKPEHYNSGKAHCRCCNTRIECIDVTKHENFNIGNAIKYLWRHKHKNGVEDLRKAIWYINSEIEKLDPPIKETGFLDTQEYIPHEFKNWNCTKCGVHINNSWKNCTSEEIDPSVRKKAEKSGYTSNPLGQKIPQDSECVNHIFLPNRYCKKCNQHMDALTELTCTEK